MKKQIYKKCNDMLYLNGKLKIMNQLPVKVKCIRVYHKSPSMNMIIQKL